ncbi:L-threonine 3-O-phosphate decarboxylase [Lachnospiraceae bacterium TWA4]|nr:L-threonine 3-O-phosphate decarboxylase [Lachnospiraceae bacterium TWA4]
MHVHGGDIYGKSYELDYSVNVNPMGTPQSVIEAAAEGAKLSAQYPDVHCTELRKAVSQFFSVPEEWLIFGNGAADLIFSLNLSIRPKKILLPAPTFAEYGQAAKVIDCELVYYYLKEENNFAIDEGFIEAITEDIDLLFLCNPNNPTGCLVDKDFLHKLLEHCKKTNTMVVIDECFNEFLDNPKDYSMMDELEHYKNLFILKAFTKTYAMAGLRLGYGLTSNQELLAKMSECNQPWAVSIPAQYAGVAALKEVDYVKKSKQILKEERTYLKNEMKRLGFKVFDSKSNYVFFKSNLPFNLQDACKKKAILIRNCDNYIGLGEGYFRISVKMPEENRKLIKIMEELIHG